MPGKKSPPLLSKAPSDPLFPAIEGEVHPLKLYHGIQVASKPDVFKELIQLCEECAQENWDGYNGAAVSAETATWAETMLRNLPPDIEPPTLSAEPDGMICLEWYRSPQQIVSVSIGGEGTLYYAVLVNDTEENGHFPPGTIWPRKILDLVKKVLAG